MTSRSHLIYLPGFPYTSATLMPKHALAAVAAVLHAQGHSVRVWDAGSLEGLKALIPNELQQHMRAAQGCLGTSAAKALRKRLIDAHQQRAAEMSDHIAISPQDWALLYIPQHRDWGIAHSLAVELRRRHPQLPILGAGAFVSMLADSLVDDESPFTGICHAADIEPTAAAFAEAAARGRDWRSVPSLTWRRGGFVQHTAEACVEDLPIPPVACYAPAVYPDASGPNQFHIATIEDTRGCATATYASPQRQGRSGELRIKPSAVIIEEILQSCTALRSRICHFSGFGVQSKQLQSLARRIAMLDMSLLYSRRLHPGHVDSSDMAALQASGCRVAGLRLDSGSQRLLDDYYGHRFTVSRFETILLAARRHGIDAAVEVTYPSPADDWHTREETMRILRRTRPASVRISWPQLWPSALWFEQARDFGFAQCAQAYRKWIHSWPLAEDNPHRWSAPERGPWRLLRPQGLAQEPLADALREEGVALGLLETDLLIGLVLGEAEVSEALALRGLLQTANTAGLSALMERFNDRAAPVLANRRLQQFVPMPAAVGN
jgi:hypothetical protein